MNATMFDTLYDKFNSYSVSVQFLILFAILNLLDFQTTKIIVDAAGFTAEVNPLLQYLLFATGTVYIILLIKMVAIGFLWKIHFYINDTHTVFTIKRVENMIKLACLLYFCVVCWNFNGVYQLGLLDGIF